MKLDYSGTPLVKKLGIKDGFKIVLFNEPKHYFLLFENWPKETKIFKSPMENDVDFIHLFCTSMTELKSQIIPHKNALKKDGLIWISWPKGKSQIPTDLNRDLIREYVLKVGLVDVKVAAIDEDWSGLKFVYRLKDR